MSFRFLVEAINDPHSCSQEVMSLPAGHSTGTEAQHMVPCRPAKGALAPNDGDPPVALQGSMHSHPLKEDDEAAPLERLPQQWARARRSGFAVQLVDGTLLTVGSTGGDTVASLKHTLAFIHREWDPSRKSILDHVHNLPSHSGVPWAASNNHQPLTVVAKRLTSGYLKILSLRIT